MDILNGLLPEILPLYLIVLMGFMAGKILHIELKPISQVAIFVLSPVVFLLSIAQMTFTANTIIAPIIMLFIATILGWAVFYITRLYLPKNLTSISAMASGTNNWGYFGLPIAFILFDAQAVALYMLLGFGLLIFQYTFSIYFLSRLEKSPLESLLNILHFPSFYAVTLGMFLSYIQFDMPEAGEKILVLFKGSFTVMGMMIIGLGLSTIKTYKIDFKFITTIIALKFVILPILALATIWLDTQLNILGTEFYSPLLLISIMPMGANNISMASQFNNNPDKVSMAVLITTLIALVYIPLAVKLLGI